MSDFSDIGSQLASARSIPPPTELTTEASSPVQPTLPCLVEPAAEADAQRYDPDADSYDPCTAVVLPPFEPPEELLKRQINALSSVIAKRGGAAMDHYRQTLDEMQQELTAAPRSCRVHAILSDEGQTFACDPQTEKTLTTKKNDHQRLNSSTSAVSVASTLCPEENSEDEPHLKVGVQAFFEGIEPQT